MKGARSATWVLGLVGLLHMCGEVVAQIDKNDFTDTVQVAVANETLVTASYLASFNNTFVPLDKTENGYCKCSLPEGNTIICVNSKDPTQPCSSVADLTPTNSFVMADPSNVILTQEYATLCRCVGSQCADLLNRECVVGAAAIALTTSVAAVMVWLINIY